MAKVGRLVKDLMVQELTQTLNDRPNFFVTAVGGLKAGEADALRKRLRSVHARLFVVKRTLGLRGIAALKLNGARDLLTGSIALVLPGEELITAAKLLVEFAKANQGKLSIRGGWVEGQRLDSQGLAELANLPSRPQLMAQLVGVIESPIAGLVMVLEGALAELAWVLEEASKTVKPVDQSTGHTDNEQAKEEKKDA